MEIPFVGPSYNLETREAAVQRTVNLIPLPQEPGNERTAWVFQDVPGLVLVQDFASDLADWLGYNDSDVGPTMQSFGLFTALGTPVAFADGGNFTNDFANNIDAVWVPLSGGSETPPTLVEGVSWFPVTPGDPVPEINDAVSGDPSEGVWSGNDWVISSAFSGSVILTGATGTTTITFTIVPGGGSNYDGATLEYYNFP